MDFSVISNSLLDHYQTVTETIAALSAAAAPGTEVVAQGLIAISIGVHVAIRAMQAMQLTGNGTLAEPQRAYRHKINLLGGCALTVLGGKLFIGML